MFKRYRLTSHQSLLLLILAVSISVLSAVLSYNAAPTELNRLHYDLSQSLNRLPNPEDLVIVEIDDKSLNELGIWPWPRSVHAQIVERLNESGVRQIVFDILFPAPDTDNPESDRAFSRSIQTAGNVVLPVYFESLGPSAPVVETPPHALFYRVAQSVGHIHLERDPDGVVRSVYLREGVGKAYWPHISLAIWNLLTPAETGARFDSERGSTSSAGGQISLVRAHKKFLPMPHASQGIRHFSYSDLFLGKIAPDLLKDKIVFIGATATGLGDVFATPAGAMHGVELNAWIFQALRNHRMIDTIEPPPLGLLWGGIVFITVMLLGRLSPKLFLIMTVISIALIGTASTAMLLLSGVWLPCAAAMLGVAAFFPLWSWLRAESMLRYLRRELQSIKKPAIEQQDNQRRFEQAREYLARMAIIDKETGLTSETGKSAAQQLHNEPNEQDFWQSQLENKLGSSQQAPAVEGVELVTRTISRLQSAQLQDQRSRKMIEQSLSALQDGVCIADLCGSVRFCNRQFIQWFGPKDAMSGNLNLVEMLDALVFSSGITWTEALQKVYAQGIGFSDEVRKRGPAEESATQTDFLLQVRLISTWRDIKDTLILVFTDISQLKAAENARTEALSFLSHDLRAPMVSVLAILQRNRDRHSLPDQEDIKSIEFLVNQNLDYAESFLQLSRAENIAQAALSPCDLHAVFDSAQVHAQALSAAKGIQIRTQRCPEDAWALGEIGLLERAVNNLISNAVKFSPEGSTITLGLISVQPYLALFVEDQGPGICETQREHLFSRFQRRERDAQHGAGLGLNFVATVAQRLNGKVEVTNLPEAGARFSLLLPGITQEQLEDYFSESETH